VGRWAGKSSVLSVPVNGRPERLLSAHSGGIADLPERSDGGEVHADGRSLDKTEIAPPWERGSRENLRGSAASRGTARA